MSLILKGIDLPKDEESSLKLLITSDGDVYKRTKDDLIFIGTNAQAIQIPTPHGRLKDVDRLIRDEVKHLLYHLPNGDTAIPKVDIDNAPTILDEEKE